MGNRSDSVDRETLEFKKKTSNTNMADVKALAEKEPAKLQEKFNGFDSDKDGNLTDKELKEFIKSLSPAHTDEQIDKMVKDADEDGDGQFSFEEFLHLIKSDKFGCPK